MLRVDLHNKTLDLASFTTVDWLKLSFKCAKTQLLQCIILKNPGVTHRNPVDHFEEGILFRVRIGVTPFRNGGPDPGTFFLFYFLEDDFRFILKTWNVVHFEGF